MWIKRFRFELRMKLATKKPGMVLKLNNLNKLTIGRFARENQPVPAKLVLITRIELIAMPMPFADRGGAVNLFGQRAALKLAGIRAKSHSPAHCFNSDQVTELEDQD